MLVKRIAAYTHLYSAVYELYGWKLQLFPTPLSFNAPVGVIPWTVFVIFGG